MNLLQSAEYKYNLPWVYVKYIIVDNRIEYVIKIQ